MNNNRPRGVVILRLSILGIILFLAIYVYTYWFSPFSGFWNDLLTNLYGILAVGLCTAAAMAIWRQYHRSDAPYAIWMYFALGLFIWLIADTTWAIYNMTVGELPKVSFADLFYVLGYVIFSIALHRQFKILFQPDPRRDMLMTGGLLATVIFLSLLLTLIFAGFIPGNVDLGSFLNIFYPIGDLAIALVSLVFVINFGHGAFGRPWLGLAIFSIADGLYAWLFESGNYSYSVLNVNFLSLIADTIYTAAYLIMAVLLLHQYLLVKYGPAAFSSRMEITQSKK